MGKYVIINILNYLKGLSKRYYKLKSFDKKNSVT